MLTERPILPVKSGLALALAVTEADEVDDSTGNRVLFNVGLVVVLTLALNATTAGSVLKSTGLVNPSVNSSNAIQGAKSHIREGLIDVYRNFFSEEVIFYRPSIGELTHYVLSLRVPDIPFKRNVDEESSTLERPSRLSTFGEEERLVDGRKRWLEALKAVYWLKLEESMHSKTTVEFCVEAADMALDEIEHGNPLNDWEKLLSGFNSFSFPGMDTFQRAMHRAQRHLISHCSRRVPSYLYWRRAPMRRFVLSTRLLIEGHEEVQRLITEDQVFFGKPEIYDKLVQESKEEVKHVKDLLAVILSNDREVAVALGTEHFANHLLAAEEEEIEKIDKSGLLQPGESKRLHDDRGYSLRRLRARPPAPKTLRWHELALTLPMFDKDSGGLNGQGKDADILNELVSNHRRARAPGQRIVTHGEAASGIFLICRGTPRASVMGQESTPLSSLWTVGSEDVMASLNSNEDAKQVYSLDCTALTDVSMFFMPTSFLQKVLHRAPAVEEMIWRDVARLVAQVHISIALGSMKWNFLTATKDAPIVFVLDGATFPPFWSPSFLSHDFYLFWLFAGIQRDLQPKTEDSVAITVLLNGQVKADSIVYSAPAIVHRARSAVSIRAEVSSVLIHVSLPA